MYSAVVREYVARHAPDEVTSQLDAVLTELGASQADGFAIAAACRTLGTAEW